MSCNDADGFFWTGRGAPPRRQGVVSHAAVVLPLEAAPSLQEMDGLIYYEDFNTCLSACQCSGTTPVLGLSNAYIQGEKVRWEKFFRCNDLGKDLPPVIEATRARPFGSLRCKRGTEERAAFLNHGAQRSHVSPARMLSCCWEAYKAFEASPASKVPQNWKEEDRPVACLERPFCRRHLLT